MISDHRVILIATEQVELFIGEGTIDYRGHTPAVNLSMGCSNMGSLDEHMSCTQLSVPFARTNNFKNSYFSSTTALWNSLNFDTSCISSLISFKHALSKEFELPDF